MRLEPIRKFEFRPIGGVAGDTRYYLVGVDAYGDGVGIWMRDLERYFDGFQYPPPAALYEACVSYLSDIQTRKWLLGLIAEGVEVVDAAV